VSNKEKGHAVIELWYYHQPKLLLNATHDLLDMEHVMSQRGRHLPGMFCIDNCIMLLHHWCGLWFDYFVLCWRYTCGHGQGITMGSVASIISVALGSEGLKGQAWEAILWGLGNPPSKGKRPIDRGGGSGAGP